MVLFRSKPPFSFRYDKTGTPIPKIRKPFDVDWLPTGKSWIARTGKGYLKIAKERKSRQPTLLKHDHNGDPPQAAAQI